MICRIRSILFVPFFQGSLAVAIIVIDGNEKRNRQLGFELQSSHVIKRRNKSKATTVKIIPVPFSIVKGIEPKIKQQQCDRNIFFFFLELVPLRAKIN